jgi:hypothetical protein
MEEKYMDGYLRKGYAKAKSVVSKDWDWVTLVDGVEGGGKSVIAQQGAYEVDPTINLERITFTPKEFREAILQATKYQAVVYDEAYTGLSSRGTMTDINKTLVSMLAEIRQKNLFVFIVMPTFFDLDRYVAIWRSRGLIHVYTDKGYGRGYFAYYNKERKKNLYIIGKKFYDYRKPKPNFRGRFTNYYVVDEEAYRQKKLKALTDHKGHEEVKDEKRFPIALQALCNHVSVRQAEKELEALGLKLSYRQIAHLIKIRKEKQLSDM